MFSIPVRNVNEALAEGIQFLKDCGEETPCRGGRQTLEASQPVCTTYTNPDQRVLFCPERDANPFLHLFESLWMLAGRRDLKFLEKLTSNFKQYSDDGINMQGSYGHRWRVAFARDQIEWIIWLFKKDPLTRRAVLSMWNPFQDPEIIDSSDIPCNTHVYFLLRNNVLDMTVCNRSNDILFGAYGANVVHMSLLMEYIANKLGAEMGLYHQMSNSYHVYKDGPGGEIWNRLTKLKYDDLNINHYDKGIEPIPLGAAVPEWDEDLKRFFNIVDIGLVNMGKSDFNTNWFRNTIVPMWMAFNSRDPNHLEHCESLDWAHAGREWLDRRRK